MPEPYELSVSEATAQIREGDLSPVELAESLLARIDALDGDLKAWVTIDREEVMETARQREIAAQWGGPLGPIHGVPVGLKDIFYTAGMLTACGSKVYARTSCRSSTQRRWRKSRTPGGIVLGKAVTTEFAHLRPVAYAQPVEPGAYPRRLQQRLIGGGSGADGSGGPGFADRRLHLPPQRPTTASSASSPPTDASAATGWFR